MPRKGQTIPKKSFQWKMDRHVFYDPMSGCWLWGGARSGGNNGNDYGATSDENGRVIYAHRASYEFFREKIPANLQIDHKCKNKLCINPDHLEVVSARENNMRSEGRASLNNRKTHCHNGHEFDEKNTWYEKNKDGSIKARHCRKCHMEIERIRRNKIKEAA